VEDLDLDSLKINGRIGGRLKTTRTNSRSGRYVRAEPLRENDRDYDVAVDASIRAALLRNGLDRSEQEISIGADDLRKKVFKRATRTLIVFVVDSSDSMGDDITYARIKAAKGAILAILDKAYKKRHRVGMVVFRDETAQTVLQPTTSLSLAERCLKTLPTGGTTPFADGLLKGWQLVKTERLKDKRVRPLLVILSDGEANVPFDPETSHDQVMAELLQICTRIGADEIGSLVIDTRPLREASGAMREIAEALSGDYHHISSLKAHGVLREIVKF
jgi:magnesium chelatase subunit D